MPNSERRKLVRRISDDCSQCDVWSTKISSLEEQSKTHVSKWTFIVVIAAYVGLAGWNSIAIKTNAENTQKKFDEISKTISDGQKEMTEKISKLIIKTETSNTRLEAVEKAINK